ncbi:DUF262 domain-containing protein [Methylovulum psychrotolerans]|uniref:DUF262 domain-containing protein n=1 Tax=Methylovulum psychrotolerans TaxID=1704499 RepID=UPI001BFEF2C2|nr:DUF262 domain-containing protein [Methylovulum psychrotolerans]MBT9096907.1 DUF262 domain-containing protein [Methylovulum psychrotolerans]
MNDKINVKPDDIYLEDLLRDMKAGEYKIPKFQRDFVWTTDQMLDLFDSILNGYPIGSLLFWKPTESFKCKDEIGPFRVNNTRSDFRYVLDGAQRMSTLFGVLMNPKEFEGKINSSEHLQNFLIYFDIKDNVFYHAKSRKAKSIFLVPLYEIYDNKELFNLIRQLDREDIVDADVSKCIENARNLHDSLHKYKIAFVDIRGGDIKSAGEIFSRVNSKGQDISKDSMLSALGYDDESDSTFSDAIADFLDRLKKYNFQDLKKDTIINCIAGATGKIYFDVKIEDLVGKNPGDLEQLAQKAFIYIEKAVGFLYEKLSVIDRRLLPYPAQLIFIAEYFRNNPNPNDNELKKLENWFWVTTYANYFTIYSLSQHRMAYSVFRELLTNPNSDGIYIDDKVDKFSTVKFPKKVVFSSVRAKAVQLFMLKQLGGITKRDESVKEQFIFALDNDRTRKPANVILRLSSEFEADTSKRDVADFIKNASPLTLDAYFISEKMKQLFAENKKEEFISAREQLIQEKECAFVESLGISYIKGG